jgi:hypothetical protein
MSTHSGTMIRFDLFLTPRQIRDLKRISRRLGQPCSYLVRNKVINLIEENRKDRVEAIGGLTV